MQLTRSFWCFISYRHADNAEPGRQWATWLHQQIETYEVPADLVGTTNGRGDVIPERIFPVFRDEDELPADADLASPIFRALDASKFLVVLCSPRAVESTYVAEEISYYKKIGRSDRVLAALLHGVPGSADQECFPKPLRHPVDADGNLLENQRAEPIAADFRLADGSEGWTSPEAYRQALAAKGGIATAEIERLVGDYRRSMELAKLKIIAGVLGIPLGTLTQRDKVYQLEKERRRAKIFRRVAAAMGVLMLAAVAGGMFAMVKKREAENERRAAMTARDAEAEQRKAADEARGVAETRRAEADAAKELAEQRRLTSETRLARSNILLAERLANEGNTAAAADALWDVPERERQWEWGHLLTRAYPEARKFQVVPKQAAAVPQGARLDITGTRAVFWAAKPTDENFNPVPGILRTASLDADGELISREVTITGGLAAVDWCRDGLLLAIDGNNVRIISPDGKNLAEVICDTTPSSAGFLDANGRRFVIKLDESWHLFERGEESVRQISRIDETYEGERFGGASPDGSLWGAVTSDTGAMLYDRDGEIVDEFPQTWGPVLAFAADGSVAITTIDESVTVRLRDGKTKTLAPAGEIIRRNTNGITAKWVGRTLFVRTIRALRTWDMNSEEVEHAGTQWDFASDEVSVGMDAGKDWAAVSLSNGQIVLFKTREMVEVERLAGHQGLVADLRFGKGDKLTSVGEDGSLRVWFPSTGVNIDFEKPIHETQPDLWTVSPEADLGGDPPPAAPGRPYGTRASITTPDGKRSMTTGDDGLIRIWNPTGPELVLSLKGPARLGLQLAISKDCRKLSGQFLTPGNDWNYEQVWSTEPWTRQAAGLNPEQDWKAAFEAERLKRYKAGWN
ncbi:MAG: TIR domain-containing protein [Akkermansiaceae bacterium]|jgi:WD40 repeat protein|nr:TIR domain-containing protein [Akkermansiaceae bacterium]